MKLLLDTIVNIYSSPGNSEQWGAALDSINNLVEGQASVYVLVNKEELFTEVSYFSGYTPEMIDAYTGRDGMAYDDVRVKYIDNLTPGKVFREMEFVPSRDEWNSHSWNKFERERLGHYYCLAGQISTHGVWSDYISVNRLESQGSYDDEQKQHLQSVLPHLARAAELHRVVSRLEQRYGAVLSVLDRFLVGLVILDPRARVVTSNLAAREIGEVTGAFSMKSGQLKICDPESNLKLQQLLAQTGKTSVNEGDSDGGHLVVESRGVGDDILFEVVPIRDDGFSDRDNVRGSAVFIMDPARASVLSAKGLKQIFNLTQSESDVVEAMINGLDVNQIAEVRRTHANTIRRQLKSAYAKTGTSGQLDLFRKAVKANPPIEGSDTDKED